MPATVPTDLDLVLLAAATYDPQAKSTVDVLGTSVRIFVTETADRTDVAIQGTHDPVGWAVDFFALEVAAHRTLDHPDLGMVHAGFYAAAELALPKLRLEIQRRGKAFAIAGHSLGAAQALLLGAILAADGTPPVKVGAFAPPRVGGKDFVDVVDSFPFCSYRFGADIVPAVPFTLPDFPYEQVALAQLVDPNVPKLGGFAAHHCDNYVDGVRRVTPSQDFGTNTAAHTGPGNGPSAAAES